MPCKEENNALLYAYGELEDEKTTAFLEHLKTCKECQNILHTCALTTAALAPKIAPEFCIPANIETQKTASFKIGFLKGMRGLRWVYPALVCGAFALAIGFTAFEFTTKKPLVSIKHPASLNLEDINTDLTSLETDFEDLFSYMQEF